MGSYPPNYKWSGRIGRRVTSSIGNMISQLLRRLSKYVYVGEIQNYIPLGTTTISCGTKIKKGGFGLSYYPKATSTIVKSSSKVSEFPKFFA